MFVHVSHHVHVDRSLRRFPRSFLHLPPVSYQAETSILPPQLVLAFRLIYIVDACAVLVRSFSLQGLLESHTSGSQLPTDSKLEPLVKELGV